MLNNRPRSRALKPGLIRLFFLSGTVFSSHKFLQNSSKSSKFLYNHTSRTPPRSLIHKLSMYSHNKLYIRVVTHGQLVTFFLSSRQVGATGISPFTRIQVRRPRMIASATILRAKKDSRRYKLLVLSIQTELYDARCPRPVQALEHLGTGVPVHKMLITE